jgi:hypothetical protein
MYFYIGYSQIGHRLPGTSEYKILVIVGDNMTMEWTETIPRFEKTQQLLQCDISQMIIALERVHPF